MDSGCWEADSTRRTKIDPAPREMVGWPKKTQGLELVDSFRGKSRNFGGPANFGHPTARCGGEDSRNFTKFLENTKSYAISENVANYVKLHSNHFSDGPSRF